MQVKWNKGSGFSLKIAIKVVRGCGRWAWSPPRKHCPLSRRKLAGKNNHELVKVEPFANKTSADCCPGPLVQKIADETLEEGGNTVNSPKFPAKLLLQEWEN